MTRRLILDASVAIKIVVAEPDSEAAERVLNHSLSAPDLLLAECGNILWKKVRRTELPAQEAADAAAALMALRVELLPATRFLPGALRRAILLDHPVYDCLYLEAAAALGVPLVTADARLRRLAPTGVEVIGLDALS
jgi:predicted nucleic acid-binding protein